ncbi:MAG: DUF134 domain-containing protein [Candidatus Omnitrophica bacterium]|nr:DUF134 domain-containing protein [Candidatus Omnitrophota bacterium]MBU4487956.1 DUF134 domain-containing protein [Candidatus Omnitrophota bacterium]MCG2704551.1 DUF134 domain-containing protein [Candidatus Omnitrophota bacterium]
MKPKGRPKKVRRIEEAPPIMVFSPRGKPGRPDEVNIAYEEWEAINLADHKGLRQGKAAMHMGISRQSFGRILSRAHRIIGDALINGKIIRIAGGSYKITKKGSI